MNMWLCLVNKEIRLMRIFFIVNAAVLIVLGLLGLIFGSLYHVGAVSLILLIFIGWHMLYLLVFLGISLIAEKRHSPTWMQSPQHAFVLLSAKFATGFGGMILSIAANLLIFLLVLHVTFPQGFQPGQPLSFLTYVVKYMKAYGPVASPFFFLHALFIASIAVLAYFLGDVIKYAVKGWRWILSFIFFFLCMGITGWFSHTPVYSALFHWGSVHFTLQIAQHSVGPNNAHLQMGTIFSWGGLLYKLLICFLCFLATAWLFDKKEEV